MVTEINNIRGQKVSCQYSFYEETFLLRLLEYVEYLRGTLTAVTWVSLTM